MPYDPITLLSQLDETLPVGDTEAASLMDDALRQTRGFVKTFLGVSFADTGVLKADAISLATMIKDGIITSAKLGAGAVAEAGIGTGAVTVNKLGDGSVTAAKLATDAVEAVKIKDGAVTSGKLGTKAVVAGKIDDDAVTSATIADDAVLAAHIADGAVAAAAQVGDGVVTATKLGAISSGIGIPVVAASAANNKMAQVGGVLTATLDNTTTPPTIVFAYAASIDATATDFYKIERRMGSGTMGGAALSGIQALGGWTEVTTNAEIGSVSGSDITLAAGAYLVTFSASAYSVGKCMAALRLKSTVTYKLYGEVVCAPPGVQASSGGQGILVVPSDDSVYELVLYCENAKATNGLGLASGAGLQEVYGQISFISL